MGASAPDAMLRICCDIAPFRRLRPGVRPIADVLQAPECCASRDPDRAMALAARAKDIVPTCPTTSRVTVLSVLTTGQLRDVTEGRVLAA